MSFHVSDHYWDILERNYRQGWAQMDSILPNTSPTPETVQEREAFLKAAKVEFVESWKSLSARPNMSPQSIWDMLQDSDAH